MIHEADVGGPGQAQGLLVTGQAHTVTAQALSLRYYVLGDMGAGRA